MSKPIELSEHAMRVLQRLAKFYGPVEIWENRFNAPKRWEHPDRHDTVSVGELWLAENFETEYLEAKLLNQPMEISDQAGQDIQLRSLRKRAFTQKNHDLAKILEEKIQTERSFSPEEDTLYAD